METFFARVKSFVCEHWILLSILLLGLLLRFYRLPEMASYDFDQEYVTNFVLDVVRIYPIRFIGQGMSVEGLFMGPWYFYGLVPFYMLTNLDPIGGFIGSVLFGGAIILAYYLVGKRIFSKEVGLMAAFLRATGFFALQADWSMVPSYSSDICILSLWLLFFWIWKHRRNLSRQTFSNPLFWLLPSVFFIFGFLTSMHPVHFHFGLVFLILVALWRVRFSLKSVGVAIVALFLPITPLLIFEYLRNFAMTRQVLMMFSGEYAGSKSEGFSWDRVMYTLKAALNQWNQVWELSSDQRLIGLSLLLLVGALLIWLLRKRFPQEKWFHFTAFGTTIFITILYYMFFPTHVPAYYLRGIQALSVLYLSFVFVELWHEKKTTKALAVFLLGLFCVLNAHSLFSAWTRTDLIRLSRKQAIIDHILEQANGQPFQVSYVTEPGWQFGYKSLFRLAELEPGEQGPVYTIVAPVNFVDIAELDFISGNVGVNYPD